MVIENRNYYKAALTSTFYVSVLYNTQIMAGNRYT